MNCSLGSAARKIHSPGYYWSKLFRANEASFAAANRYGRYHQLTLRNVSMTSQNVLIDAKMTNAKFFCHGFNCPSFGSISFRECQMDNVNNFSVPYQKQYVDPSGNKAFTLQPISLGVTGQPNDLRNVCIATEYEGPIANSTVTAQGLLSLTLSVSQNSGAIIASLSDWSHCHGECYIISSGFEQTMAIDSINSSFILLNDGKPF